MNELGIILDLRFIDVNGQKVLQLARTGTIHDGEVVLDWEDVRTEET